MRIGIDMSPIVNEAAGIGQYVINVFKNIMEIDTENEYYLFTYDKIRFPYELTERWHIVYYGGKKKRARNFFTELPFLLRKYKIDRFVGTRHYLPPFNHRRIHYVAIVHDLIPLIMPELFTTRHLNVFKLCTKICQHQADTMIAVSEATKKDIIKYLHFPEEKIHVVYEGANPIYNTERDEAAIAATMNKFHIDSDYILCLSTVEPRKNMLRTIQAFEKCIIEQKKSYKLVIVGGKGWNNGEIYDYVQEKHLEEYVIFTGYVENEEVKHIYANASLFIYASLYEGFGLPVLEAMQSGIPVITSNLSSMPEVAGDACELIDPYNIAELEHAIVRIMESEDLRKSMSERGIEQAKNFSWRKCAEQTLYHILNS